MGIMRPADDSSDKTLHVVAMLVIGGWYGGSDRLLAQLFFVN